MKRYGMVAVLVLVVVAMGATYAWAATEDNCQSPDGMMNSEQMREMGEMHRNMVGQSNEINEQQANNVTKGNMMAVPMQKEQAMLSNNCLPQHQ